MLMEPPHQAPHDTDADAVDASMAQASEKVRSLQSPTEIEVVLTKGACGFGIYFTAAADGTAVVDPTTPFYRLPDGTPAPGEACGVIAAGDRLLAINTTNVERWRFAEVVDELRRTPVGDATLRFRRVEPSVTSNDKYQDNDEDTMPPLEPAADAAVDVRVESGTPSPSDPPRRVRWRLFDWPATGATTTTTPAPAFTTTDNPSGLPSHEDAMNRSGAMEQLLVEMETRLRELEVGIEREKKCRFLAEKKNILYRNALCTLSEENAQLRDALAVKTHAHEAVRRFQEQKLHLSI